MRHRLVKLAVRLLAALILSGNLTACTTLPACPDVAETRPIPVTFLSASWERTFNVKLDPECVPVSLYLVSQEELDSECTGDDNVACTVMCGDGTQGAWVVSGSDDITDSFVHEVAHYYMHCSGWQDDASHENELVWGSSGWVVSVQKEYAQ